MAPPKTSAHPAAQAPSTTLRLETIDAVDDALMHVGLIDALEARIRADCDAAVAETKARYVFECVPGFSDQHMPIAEARRVYIDAVKVFAETHRAALLAGDDKKSRDLNFGTIGWRKSKDRLVPVEGGPAAGNAALLDKTVAFLNTAVEKMRVFAAGTCRFLKINVKFDQTALLSAFEKGQVQRDELRKAGFTVEIGGDQFFATPDAAAIASHAAVPAGPGPARATSRKVAA